MNGVVRSTFVVIALLSFVSVAHSADAPAPMPVKAATTSGPGALYFGGASVGPHSWFVDAGAVWASNRNLDLDGPLFRLYGGTGRYDYLMMPGAEIDVRFHVGEMMVGYQRAIGSVRYTGYIGAQVQHHDNDDDPGATIDGTKWGVSAIGEVFAPFGDRAYALFYGQISSVWSSYYVLGKLGYLVAPRVWMGPEVVAMGNKRFDAQRLGMFWAYDFMPGSEFVLSAGYHWQDTTFRNQDGVYATVHVRMKR